MRALFVTVRMKPEYRDRILKGALEDGRGSREDELGCLRKIGRASCRERVFRVV